MESHQGNWQDEKFFETICTESYWQKKELETMVLPIESNTIVPPTADQGGKNLWGIYINKLVQPFPGSCKVIEGWLTKEQGIKFWFMITYSDVHNILHLTAKAITVNNCKENKNYNFSRPQAFKNQRVGHQSNIKLLHHHQQN